MCFKPVFKNDSGYSKTIGVKLTTLVIPGRRGWRHDRMTGPMKETMFLL